MLINDGDNILNLLRVVKQINSSEKPYIWHRISVSQYKSMQMDFPKLSCDCVLLLTLSFDTQRKL